jgi:hypothetical protein
MDIHLIPVRMAIIKTTKTNAGKVIGEEVTLI